MSGVEAVLDVARAEVGVHEVGGNNRGQRVEAYLAAVGLGPGQPWCAAFVAWAFQRAQINGWPATGDTWAIRSWAREHGCLRRDPAPGDVFLLLDGAGNPTHTGFVSDVQGGYVTTIEGNTGMASDTDGDGVAAKHRPVLDCRFVHWQELLAPAGPDRVKVFWHDGHGALVDRDGQTWPIRGVKINGKPWPGGEIIVGL